MMTISVYRRMTWRDDIWTVKTYEHQRSELRRSGGGAFLAKGTVWFPEVTFKLMIFSPADIWFDKW